MFSEMENLTCVIDAKTFVDNIQEVKGWVYRGHIHLFVTSNSMTLSDTDQENEAEVLTVLESVDKLCEKSKEAKTTGNDQMRAKNAGKATKKEYPTFDINPKIAQEYLVRARKSKDGEPVAKDRPLYVAEESQEALEFQTQGEEYTRWKDVPLEDAKPEKQDEKPATWADAARKKANAANGLGGKAESTKGMRLRSNLTKDSFLIRECNSSSETEISLQDPEQRSFALENPAECSQDFADRGASKAAIPDELCSMAHPRKHSSKRKQSVVPVD